MTTLLEKLKTDLSESLKSRQTVAISTLRMLLSEIHNQEIQKKRPATDEDVLTVLSQALKKHQDSISQFREGQRSDLVASEEAEAKIIRSYLPETLSEEELKTLIQGAIAGIKAKGPQDFGKVMKVVMPKVKGRAEGSRVSTMLSEQLAKQNGL